jgi:hypothetical protein
MKNLTKFNVYWVCPLLARNNDSIQILEPLSASLIIYDYKVLEMKLRENEYLKLFDPHVVNISFKKSWNGRRKSIDRCPCWLSLSVNIDYILMMREKKKLDENNKICKFM